MVLYYWSSSCQLFTIQGTISDYGKANSKQLPFVVSWVLDQSILAYVFIKYLYFSAGEGNGTPVLLPGKSHGRRSLVGCSPWGCNWATSLSLFTFMHWRRKWQPTPVFLPGESQGWGSLVGCRLWGHRVGHDWSDLAAAGIRLSSLTQERSEAVGQLNKWAKCRKQNSR